MYGSLSGASAGSRAPEGVPPVAAQFTQLPQGWCRASAALDGTVVRSPYRQCWVRIESRGVFAYRSTDDMRQPLFSMPDLRGAEIIVGRSVHDADPNLQRDGGDERLHGELYCQFVKGEPFHRFDVEVTDDGRMLFREPGAGEIASSANLTDPISGETAGIRDPKSSRRGRPWCFRVDLACNDSRGRSKYMFDPGSEQERDRWCNGLCLRTSEFKVVVSRTRDLLAHEHVNVSRSGRVNDGNGALEIIFSHRARADRDRLADSLRNISADRAWNHGAPDLDPEPVAAPMGQAPLDHCQTPQLLRLVPAQYYSNEAPTVYIGDMQIGARTWSFSTTWPTMMDVWDAIQREDPAPYDHTHELHLISIVVQDAVSTKNKTEQAEAQDRAVQKFVETMIRYVFEERRFRHGEHQGPLGHSRERLLNMLAVPADEWFIYQIHPRGTHHEVHAWSATLRHGPSRRLFCDTLVNVDHPAASLLAMGNSRSRAGEAAQDSEPEPEPEPELESDPAYGEALSAANPQQHYETARRSYASVSTAEPAIEESTRGFRAPCMRMHVRNNRINADEGNSGSLPAGIRVDHRGMAPQFVCYKPTEIVRIFVQRYGRIQGKRLNFYDSANDVKWLGHSVADLTQYTIEWEGLVETYTFQADKYKIQVRLKPEFGGSGTHSDIVEFCLDSRAERDRVGIALTNVSEGRDWDAPFDCVYAFPFSDSLLWYRHLDDARPAGMVSLAHVNVRGLSIVVDASAGDRASILPGECVLVAPFELPTSRSDALRLSNAEQVVEQPALQLQLQWVSVLHSLKQRSGGHPRLPMIFCRNLAGRDMLISVIFGTVSTAAAFTPYKELWYKCIADPDAAPLLSRLYTRFISLAGDPPPISRVAAEEYRREKELKLILSDLTSQMTRNKHDLAEAQKKVEANKRTKKETAVISDELAHAFEADQQLVDHAIAKVAQLKSWYHETEVQLRQEQKRLKQVEAAENEYPRAYASELCNFLHLCTWNVAVRAIFCGVDIHLHSTDSRQGRDSLRRFQALMRAILGIIDGWTHAAGSARTLLAELEHPASGNTDVENLNSTRTVSRIPMTEIEWLERLPDGRYAVDFNTTTDHGGEFSQLLRLFDPTECTQFFTSARAQEELERLREGALTDGAVPTSLRSSSVFQQKLTDLVFSVDGGADLQELWHGWVLAPDSRAIVDLLYKRFITLAGTPAEDIDDTKLLESLQVQLDANKAETKTAASLNKDSATLTALQHAQEQLVHQIQTEKLRLKENEEAFQRFHRSYAQAFLQLLSRCSTDVGLRSLFLAFSIEARSTDLRSSIQLGTARDLRSELQALDEDTVAARARAFGMSQDEIDDCAFLDDPIEAMIVRLEDLVGSSGLLASHKELRLELEQMGGAALKKRAQAEGVDDRTVASIMAQKVSSRKSLLVQAILDAVNVSSTAGADTIDKSTTLDDRRDALECWLRTYNYITEKIDSCNATGEWEGMFLEYLHHPASTTANVPTQREEQRWLSTILEKRFTVVLGGREDYGGEFERLSRLFDQSNCVLFFLEHAYRTVDSQRLVELMHAVDVHAVRGGRAFDARPYVSYIFRLERHNQVEILRNWHDVRALNNGVFGQLVDEAFQNEQVEIILKCLNQVLLVSDDTDLADCTEAPHLILRALDRHREALTLNEETFLLFELVLRFGRTALFDQMCNEIVANMEVTRKKPVYMTTDFLVRFQKYFRVVCQENQDTGTANLSRMLSISDKTRDESQISAAIIGLLKLLWFTSDNASDGLGLRRVHDFFAECGAYMFDKHLRRGSALLSDVVHMMRDDLVPSDAQLIPDIASRLLDDSAEHPITLSPTFFTEDVQGLVTNAAQRHARGGLEDYHNAVHVVLRLIDNGMSYMPLNGRSLYERVLRMLDPIPGNRLTAQRHLRSMLQRLLAASRDELRAQPDANGTVGAALSVEDILECVRSAVAAVQALQGCPADAVEVMNTYFAHTLTQRPESWKQTLLAADNIAFFIK